MWAAVIGIAMIAVTVTIHAFGSARWLAFVSSKVENGETPDLRHLPSLLIATATVLLLLHLGEALLWALLYVALPDHSGLESFSEAVYFSIVTITTLGYGDLTLEAEWELLAGMEAMVGIVVFGFTTALIFAVVQRCWRFRHSSGSSH